MNAATASYDWFDDTGAGQTLTALCVAPLQAVAGLMWVLGCIARMAVSIVRENAGNVTRLAGIVGVVVLLCLVWQLAVGGALVAAYGWMTWK